MLRCITGLRVSRVCVCVCVCVWCAHVCISNMCEDRHLCCFVAQCWRVQVQTAGFGEARVLFELATNRPLRLDGDAAWSERGWWEQCLAPPVASAVQVAPATDLPPAGRRHRRKAAAAADAPASDAHSPAAPLSKRRRKEHTAQPRTNVSYVVVIAQDQLVPYFGRTMGSLAWVAEAPK